MAEFSLRQVQGLRQEQVLLPSMIQSIQLLQLATTDLSTYLEQAGQENVALVVERRAGPVNRGSSEASDRFDAWLNAQPDREPGLAEILEEQLLWMNVPEALDPWVRHVIASLESSGLLEVADETLLEEARVKGIEGDAGALGRAIAIVQTMEPAGIGGRDQVEALLLQLNPGHEDYATLAVLLESHLDDLVRNKLPKVAKALGLELPRLEELLVELRGLELAPGERFSNGGEPALVPDLTVENVEGRWEVRLEDGSLPAVHVDADVETLAREKELDREVKSYLKQKVEEARWIVDAVEQRRRTLLRVARATFARQVAFLEDGRDKLKPLRMTEVAEELEIHLSTVSRAVSGKHVSTPFGLLPLRWFFQGAGGGNQDQARDSVRDRVKALIDGEDADAPLSDEDLVKSLAAEDVKVARRTVAKYRKELGIPSSYRRRKYS